MAKFSFIIVLFLGLTSAQRVDPCQSLSQSYQSRVSKNQSAIFHPSEVLACLRTVPVNETLSLSQIEWYQNFIQFQTTLSYLRNPPSWYEHPAVDILGGLQRISSKIESSGYNNTFDIELDLVNLVNTAYDGHFSVNPLLVSGASFTSLRNVQLVSLSVNGTDLPRVYFSNDLYSTNASDLVTIDGIEVNKAIQNVASGFQDLDALYNSMLFNLPDAFYDVYPSYYLSQIFVENDNTTYEFRNGTKRIISNSIEVNLPLNNITSGQDLYDKLLNPKSASNGSSKSSTRLTMGSSGAGSSAQSSPQNPSVVFPRGGYPVPLFSTNDLSFAGFFLPNSTDTCVLNSLGFANPLNGSDGFALGAAATSYGLDFQNVIKNFLAACVADGRTKLIIDVRTNGGGFIYFAYDLFRQLFPSRIPYTAARLRAHPAANILGEVISTAGPLTIGEDGALAQAKGSDFNYLNSLSSPSQSPFSSWADMYGPQTIRNDTFTNLLAWKFSDAALDLDQAGIIPTGFANNTQLASQPFADENITLITDAQCTSTCTIFVNLLLSQTNVSTIAFGGRPTRDPMAVVGGSEGCEVAFYEGIAGYAQSAFELLTDNSTAASASQSLNTSKQNALEILRQLIQDPPLQIAGGLASQTVNFRDSIPKGDQSMTPFQFTAPILADCKLFYQRSDLINVTNTWERVAKRQFVCADGGVLGRRRNGTLSPAPYTHSLGYQTRVSLVNIMPIVIGLLLLRVLW